MADHLFEEPKLAELYDLFSPSAARDDFGFYLPLLMSASSVLDVGCGTGALLGLARSAGHTGQLVGIDPARGMIDQARKRPDIEWIHGELDSSTFSQEFELAVMTGHAFQVLIEDEEIVNALTGIKSLLNENGRFAFETRNPLARAWEHWSSEYSGHVIDGSGSRIDVVCSVNEIEPGETVRFSHTFSCSDWSRDEVSHSRLRFLGIDSLNSFLHEAGFEIEHQYGDWTRSPVTADSPEIITVARRVER